jgi:small subunit ribosomal protein S16
MLKIRLQRVGRKHEPTFRVVLTDSKNSTKSGKFLEILGSYDARKSVDVLHGDKIKEWMGKGAQVSDTIHNLLVKHKIVDSKKKNVLPRKSPYKTEAKMAEEKAIADAAEAKAKADRAEAEALAAKAEEEKAAAEAAAATPEEPAVEETPTVEPSSETEPAVEEVVS